MECSRVLDKSSKNIQYISVVYDCMIIYLRIFHYRPQRKWASSMYYEYVHYELRTNYATDTVASATVCGMNEMNDRAFLSSTLKDRIFLEIKMCRVLCRRLYYLKS